MGGLSPENRFDIVRPSAAAMIESMRAYGYSIPTAIADIIDNSISAGASNVWLDFHWSGRDSWLAIVDDGSGMDESTLRDAMKPGSQSPLAVRSDDDLGRFGLGLKTASFSQCRRLTVGSKVQNDVVAVRRWDLDHVSATDEWQLLRYLAEESSGRLDPIQGLEHGTAVLWEQLDRIVGSARVGDEQAHGRFLDMIDEVEQHLAMVFHRFLDGPNPRLKIFINGKDQHSRVIAWDPFLEDFASTTRTPLEEIQCSTGKVSITGFVLPHKDRLGADEFLRAAGPAGWNAQQGFYVYRNERMLVSGSWLGLGRPRGWTKEEHYKLARIRVDIPNTQDIAWQLDVKKSTARPPAEVRSRLTDLAEAVRGQARRVFAHRGSYQRRERQDPISRPWLSTQVRERLIYRVNRDHPLIQAILNAEADEREKIDAALKLLEETVPVQQIWLDVAEKSDLHGRPFEALSEEEILGLMRPMVRHLRAQNPDLDVDGLRSRMMSMEGFADYPGLIDEVLDVPRR